MIVQEYPRRSPSLILAIVASLVLHGLVLFVQRQTPESNAQPPGRLEAALRPRPQSPPPAAQPVAPQLESQPKQQTPAKPKNQRPVLAVPKSKTQTASQSKPKWTVAQKEEMDQFLKELEPKNKVKPDLAQRSMAMAREYGREQAREDSQGSEMLERRPNSPPVDPFSLEMYLDSLVRKLNRSAGYVKNEPRTKGMKSALVRVQLNPDGSMRNFKVVNAGDQQMEIAYIKSVVEQAVPFAPFPADILRSAKSLTMMICIQPPSMSGGFGFSRVPEGSRC
jgi:hypothetical protein